MFPDLAPKSPSSSPCSLKPFIVACARPRSVPVGKNSGYQAQEPRDIRPWHQRTSPGSLEL